MRQPMREQQVVGAAGGRVMGATDEGDRCGRWEGMEEAAGYNSNQLRSSYARVLTFRVFFLAGFS